MKTWRALNEKVLIRKLGDTSKFLFLNKGAENLFPTQNWKLWIPALLENYAFKNMNYRYLLVTNETRFLEDEYHSNNIVHLSLDEMAQNIYK